MPLIKPRANRVRTLRHIARLQEPNRDTLLAYARFIGESADYVLNQTIAETLAKDRDFISWRATQPPADSAPNDRLTIPPTAAPADTTRTR
jgi:hypothetical protein